MSGGPGVDEKSLPAVLDRLYAAIGRLCDERKEWLDGELRAAPSPYQQLVDAVVPGSRVFDGYGYARGKAPCWVAPIDMRRSIDDTVRGWFPVQPDPRLPKATPNRLRALASRNWRPQDSKPLDGWSARLESWVVQIDELLAPPRRWSLPSPCPACGTTVVYRLHGGENVRQPALSIGPHGCECAYCHTVWTPDKFVFLAGLLGSLPDGVLE